ncbi:hypothetical protein GCWU000322_00079 [Eubacterium saphenum ATCC 49989]|nr:hypothetical protein GCWU000322_00079 [Eubacterium saphenum ATCC 49989]
MADEVKEQVVTEPSVKDEAQADVEPKADDTTPEANTEPKDVVYTQADIDSAVEKRLARERRKYPSKEELAEFKAWKAEQKSEPEDEALISERARVKSLETKLACHEAGVRSDSVEAVTAIAEKMVNDGDAELEEAIEQVLTKYPAFKADSQKPAEANKAWGSKHQEGATPLSGVEESFFKLNPRLKQ